MDVRRVNRLTSRLPHMLLKAIVQHSNKDYSPPSDEEIKADGVRCAAGRWRPSLIS